MLLELLCEVKQVEEPWLLVEPLCNCMQEALSLGLRLAGRVLQQILAALQQLVALAIENPPKNKGESAMSSIYIFLNAIITVLIYS